MEAEQYITQFNDLLSRLNGKGKTNVAIAILQEIAKDRRMAEIRAEQENGNGEPATQKQLDYLRDLGAELKEGLTKKQASEMIEELRAKQQIIEVAV